ncbi:FliM/FliN family flagellar motor switch protein [Aliiroseovarius crassostreae]|uniref:FliM/FliN family flagellar motor switch protein n=1 Tax=Aliiroseovarius crassostreae TaxID=154981 RepID=UPI00220DB28A|nr:FliM/FliN family flagellar motor switch protein [Aliiroseovarius crassostreae]UWP99349.1 FliM/FliN family flagellar motor switch protein [Aliiroseovarius crassostreae]
MSDADQKNVKRRLAGEGRPPPEICRMTPELALKLALARACETSVALEVFAQSVEMRRLVLSTLVEELPENALVTLLQGPKNQMGLVLFDAQALAGVIEKQTTGRVVPNPAAERAPTRTDAVMCADLIDDILRAFHAEGEDAGLPGATNWQGFKYVMPLENARAIQMTMEDIPYRLFDVHLDMENGAKQGRIWLMFPFEPPQSAPAPSVGEAEEDGALAEVVQGAETRLEAVLHRLEMPLSQVTALEVGSLLPIPSKMITQIQLEDILGEKVCHGALGGKAGHRALRINLSASEPDAPDPINALSAGNLSSDPGLFPQKSEQPALGGLPAAPGLAGAGDGDLTGLPDLPDLPPLDPAEAGAGIGDLPALEAVGDLPDLSDLASLGGHD